MSRTIIITDEERVELARLLMQIIQQIGPYKMDNYEHAVSVMDNSSDNALRIVEILNLTSEESVKK